MSRIWSELSAQTHIDAVLERSLSELVQRGAALIHADVDFNRPTPVVPPSRRPAEHPAVHTSRRSDAG
jgi:hypothetical protein